MSWFKELTSQAEAMLVKLDQNAAQKLQNPANSKNWSNSLDQVSDKNNFRDKNESESEQLLRNETEKHGNDCDLVQEQVAYTNTTDETSNMLESDVDSLTNQSFYKGSVQLGEAASIQNQDNNQDISSNNNVEQDNKIESSQETSAAKESSQPKKFTIQASKTNAHLFVLERQSPKGAKSTKKNPTQMNGSTRLDTNLTSPDANDIRASINRSLQEYTSQTVSTPYNVPIRSPSSSKQTKYQSHFDSQPNIIQHSPLLETSTTSRLHSSPSFSIDVPEDATGSRLSNDIALRLLQQSASKKKSTFYLHKVINRLAGSDGQASAIFGDQLRIKFRRNQIRVASYARRLNYYFRAYPMMKYMMVGYLVIMQILVIYVLFFYQSSGSSTELSAQIKKQQRELTESQLTGDSKPPVINNL